MDRKVCFWGLGCPCLSSLYRLLLLPCPLTHFVTRMPSPIVRLLSSSPHTYIPLCVFPPPPPLLLLPYVPFVVCIVLKMLVYSTP